MCFFKNVNGTQLLYGVTYKETKSEGGIITSLLLFDNSSEKLDTYPDMTGFRMTENNIDIVNGAFIDLVVLSRLVWEQKPASFSERI